jgi:hypothetical protein
MAGSIVHLPEKPRERDHNKQQIAVMSGFLGVSTALHRLPAVGYDGAFHAGETTNFKEILRVATTFNSS